MFYGHEYIRFIKRRGLKFNLILAYDCFVTVYIQWETK